MLTDYDASAVAAVLGVAFIDDPHPDSPALPTHAHLFTIGGASVEVRRAVPDQACTRVPSPMLIERAVEHGLPRYVLRHVAEHLAGGDETKVTALERAVVPKTTLDRREDRLSPRESERTERVARLIVHARRALGTEAEARQFITTPHPRLEGRTPFDAARTDLGTRRAEHLLNALEFGLAL